MNTAGVVTRKTLSTFVARVDDLGGPSSPDAVAYWGDFRYQPDAIVNQALDPMSHEYFLAQLSLYKELSGRELNQEANELTDFDMDRSVAGPNPYGDTNTKLMAEHVRGVCDALMIADLGSNPAVLDMGSGWGLSSEVLAFTGCSVTAVDINHKFVELVRRRAARRGLNIDAVQASFDEFRADVKFDAVFFYECLHHATKPWELLKRCADWLKPQGKIVISGEPINEIWWRHWGLRLDPLSVYCIHKFGWFESGWSLQFLKSMLFGVGLSVQVFEGRGMGGSGVIVAKRSEECDAPNGDEACRGGADSLNRDLEAVRAELDRVRAERDTLLASRSWRMTGPFRWLFRKLR